MYQPNDTDRVIQQIAREAREYARRLDQLLQALEAQQERETPRREWRRVTAPRRVK